MIQSVDRAVQILLELQGARRLGVSEIASRLGLAKTTVHGLLRTLVDRAMVEQDAASGRYGLGPALLRMGNVYLDSHDLRARSIRWAEDLAQRTGGAVRVGVAVMPDVVVVHHVPAPGAGPYLREIGIAIPAHAGCLGKAILAFRPDLVGLLAFPLPRLTGTTITEPERLRRELAGIRLSAVATEEEEAVLGESGAAGAVFGTGDKVVGAISVVLPAGSLDAAAIEAVAGAARSISREMGASGWPPS